jgi:hypothetical protein
MSLNRCEQRIFDYLQGHPEERQFWIGKVQSVCRGSSEHAAAARLESELWRYYEERSAVAAPFVEAALWTEPRPKKKPAEFDAQEIV